jgi:hypothetical protein
MPAMQASLTKHVCAKCGKVRSSKYHHENPLKPGEVPAPAFCGRCERDLTSTDVSDTGHIEEHKKKSKRRDKVSNFNDLRLPLNPMRSMF